MVDEREVAAEWVLIDAVHPWENNPRDNKAAIGQVARSIKRFGFASPIIARKADGEIIAGHTRYSAAKQLKLRKIPVRFLDLDPTEAHVLALADNKLGEVAEWNDELLASILGTMSADVDLTNGTGFTSAELEKLTGGSLADGDGDEGVSQLGSDLSYSVIVACEDEQQQSMLLDRLEGEGFKCKPLIS